MNGNAPSIHPDITIKTLLDYCPDLLEVLIQNCVGYEYPGTFNCRLCPMADEETLEQAASTHGIHIDRLIDLLTDFIANRDA